MYYIGGEEGGVFPCERTGESPCLNFVPLQKNFQKTVAYCGLLRKIPDKSNSREKWGEGDFVFFLWKQIRYLLAWQWQKHILFPLGVNVKLDIPPVTDNHGEGTMCNDHRPLLHRIGGLGVLWAPQWAQGRAMGAGGGV